MRRLWVACIGVAIIGALYAGTAAASQFRWLRWTPRRVLPRATITGSAWAQALANRSRTVEARTTVHMIWGECPWYGGEADGCTDMTTIWERPNLGPQQRAFDFYHELGHIFETDAMTDRARQRFIAITHDHAGWETPDPGPVSGSPRERFADAYALCATYGPHLPESEIAYIDNGNRPFWLDDWLSGYGYDPTPRQHAAVCRLIMHAAIRPASS